MSGGDPRDEIERLEREIALLRDEAWEQFQTAHAEMCGHPEWPHEGQCHWPPPDRWIKCQVLMHRVGHLDDALQFLDRRGRYWRWTSSTWHVAFRKGRSRRVSCSGMARCGGRFLDHFVEVVIIMMAVFVTLALIS